MQFIDYFFYVNKCKLYMITFLYICGEYIYVFRFQYI